MATQTLIYKQVKARTRALVKNPDPDDEFVMTFSNLVRNISWTFCTPRAPVLEFWCFRKHQRATRISFSIYNALRSKWLFASSWSSLQTVEYYFEFRLAGSRVVNNTRKSVWKGMKLCSTFSDLVLVWKHSLCLDFAALMSIIFSQRNLKICWKVLFWPI